MTLQKQLKYQNNAQEIGSKSVLMLLLQEHYRKLGTLCCPCIHTLVNYMLPEHITYILHTFMAYSDICHYTFCAFILFFVDSCLFAFFFHSAHIIEDQGEYNNFMLSTCHHATKTFHLLKVLTMMNNVLLKSIF